MITLQGKSCRRIKDYQKNVNIVGVEKGKVYRLFTAHERCYRRLEVYSAVVDLSLCLAGRRDADRIDSRDENTHHIARGTTVTAWCDR